MIEFCCKIHFYGLIWVVIWYINENGNESAFVWRLFRTYYLKSNLRIMFKIHMAEVIYILYVILIVFKISAKGTPAWITTFIAFLRLTILLFHVIFQSKIHTGCIIPYLVIFANIPYQLKFWTQSFYTFRLVLLFLFIFFMVLWFFVRFWFVKTATHYKFFKIIT